LNQYNLNKEFDNQTKIEKNVKTIAGTKNSTVNKQSIFTSLHIDKNNKLQFGTNNLNITNKQNKNHHKTDSYL
jgi:hypothetical protein